MKSGSSPWVRRMCTVLSLAACLAVPYSVGADEGPPPYAKVVLIAVVAPLSGPERQYGIDLSNGVQAAIDDANQARSLTDFYWQMQSFDDQGDPGIAQQEAQFALVDPRTAVVIGHLGGQETFLALPVYHQAGIPVIIPTASLAALTQQGYDNVFRLCPPDTIEGALAARYVERTVKPANVAVLWEQDDYGNDTATNFVNYLKSAKIKVVDYPIDVDLKDLAKTVAAVASQNPDYLYVTGMSNVMSKVVIAVRKAGITAPLLTSGTFYSNALLADKAFGSAAQGMLVGTCVPPVQFMPSAQVFQQRYEANHGRLSAYALFGYAAAQVAINAAVVAHTTEKQALIHELGADVFRTVIGDVSFRPNGDPLDPDIYFYRADNGGFNYVGSALPNPAVLR